MKDTYKESDDLHEEMDFGDGHDEETEEAEEGYDVSEDFEDDD